MILRLFKQTYFTQIVLLIVLALILWLPAFIKPYPVLSSESNLFTNFIFSQSVIDFPILSKILAIALLLFEAFLLSYLFSSHQLTHRNSFLSGFLFVLFLSRTPEHLGFHPGLIALLFLLIGLKKLLENFKSSRSHDLLLSASFLFSLASLFIFPVLYLFPVIWISLIIFQSFNWRSIPISLVGLLIPYFIIAIGYIWFDKGLVFIQRLITLVNSHIGLPKLPGTNELFEFLLTAFLLILASIFILPRIGNKVISIRKKTGFMYWFLGFTLLISFFTLDNIAREIVFIPFAAILGFYFSAVKRQFWADIFISLVFILILIQNYQILFNA